MSPRRDVDVVGRGVIVTDIGANASSTGPSAVSIDAIVDVKPDGSTITSSPGLNTPPATVPA